MNVFGIFGKGNDWRFVPTAVVEIIQFICVIAAIAGIDTRYPIILTLQGLPSIIIMAMTTILVLYHLVKQLYLLCCQFEDNQPNTLMSRKLNPGDDFTYVIKICAFTILNGLVEQRKQKTGIRDKLFFKKDALIHGLYHTYNMWLFVFRILYYAITNPFIKDQQAILNQNALAELYRDIEIVENRTEEGDLATSDRQVDHTTIEVSQTVMPQSYFHDIY
ncbi:hypothetical protein HDV04_006183 [Boothiomyces sp. JEL0838]|nr:hypothetical protein HDV04_006183 [Boothiomyces sp. JEL0838]